DGRTLADQITGPLRSLVDATVGIPKASRMVIGVELLLAVTVWNRRAWPFVAPLGILFHFGIVLSGLEIGLFAWLMIAIYIFVVPDRVWTWLAETPPLRLGRDAAHVVASWFEDSNGRIALGVSGAIGVGLAVTCRFEHALVVGLVVTTGA